MTNGLLHDEMRKANFTTKPHLENSSCKNVILEKFPKKQRREEVKNNFLSGEN